MTFQTRMLALCVVLAVAYANYSPSPAPQPEPQPTGLSLRGLFVGETAAEDAAAIAALCDEIASEIAWDGTQDEPYLKTGVAFDELRTRARMARMRGESFSDRQPAACDKIAQHLSLEVGDQGGPVDDAQRSRWVAAYREIAEACRNALGR